MLNVPVVRALGRGAADLRGGLAAHALWRFMGWQDVRQRYRRTVLGPWWLTISTGILLFALGAIWSEMFGMDLRAYLPYFVTGYVLWMYFAGVLSDACTGFTQFEGFIKQQRIPFSTYIYRIGMRHAVIFAHNAVIIVAYLLWTGQAWSAVDLLAIPGALVFGLAVLMLSVPVAVVCTRYRDAPPIVASFLQIGFFVTPIFYRPDTLQRYRWIADWNPVAILIDIVRLPLLGMAPAVHLWVASAAIFAVAAVLGAWLLGRYGHRLVYWL